MGCNARQLIESSVRNWDKIQQDFDALMAQQDYAAEMDAGFDGGEFSGPAHDDMLQGTLERFQVKHQLTDDEISQLLHGDRDQQIA